MKKQLIVIAALLMSASFSCAQDASVDDHADEWQPNFNLKDKAIRGNQGYWSNDVYGLAGLPDKLNLNADYTSYHSNASPMTTHAVTFGAGKDWDLASFGVSYSVTPLANDYRSNAVDVNASAWTPIKDFRTTAGIDMNIARNVYYVRFPTVTGRGEITQKTPTYSVKQQLFNTKATVDFSDNRYNKDIAAISNQLARFLASHPVAAYYAGKSANAGVLKGFPTRSVKLGLYQDFELLPITLWGTWQNTHFLAVKNSDHVTADSFTTGADVSLLTHFTAGAQYEYVRQTSQAANDYYGASASVMF